MLERERREMRERASIPSLVHSPNACISWAPPRSPMLMVTAKYLSWLPGTLVGSWNRNKMAGTGPALPYGSSSGFHPPCYRAERVVICCVGGRVSWSSQIVTLGGSHLSLHLDLPLKSQKTGPIPALSVYFLWLLFKQCWKAPLLSSWYEGKRNVWFR